MVVVANDALSQRALRWVKPKNMGGRVRAAQDLTGCHWLPINEHGAQNLRRAADAAAQPAATVLVDLVADLTRDPRWVAMTDRRDTDFHRWRPQSVSGGVATSNPWEPNPDGGFRMRAYATSQHRPPETGPLLAEASAGLEALATTMNDWLTAWPAALRSLGVALFTQDRP